MNITDLAFLCSEELLWTSNITEGEQSSTKSRWKKVHWRFAKKLILLLPLKDISGTQLEHQLDSCQIQKCYAQNEVTNTKNILKHSLDHCLHLLAILFLSCFYYVIYLKIT